MARHRAVKPPAMFLTASGVAQLASAVGLASEEGAAVAQELPQVSEALVPVLERLLLSL